MKNNQQSEYLPNFFIIGPERSGTTLLRLLLNKHSQICIPQETYFITKLHLWLKENNINLSEEKQFNKFCAVLVDDEHFKTTILDKINIDRGIVEKILQKCMPSESLAYSEAFKLYSESENKNIVGEKTPQYALHLDVLHKLFPEAVYIYIVRDGRDVYNSLKKVNWEWLNKNDFFLSKRWQCWIKSMSDFENTCPDKIIKVPYHELVHDPKSILGDICNFLGVEYEELMLSFHDKAIEDVEKGTDRGHHEKLLSPISTSYIDVWKKELSNEEIRLFELVNGKQLKEQGFSPITSTLQRLTPSSIRYFLKQYKNYLSRINNEDLSYYKIWLKNVLLIKRY